VRGMVDDGNICLVIARVLGNFGGASLFQISEAITWLVDQKVRIINMSVGSPTSFTALQDAVDYAEQQGVLFVASAGCVYLCLSVYALDCCLSMPRLTPLGIHFFLWNVDVILARGCVCCLRRASSCTSRNGAELKPEP
jgi:Subtilase family